MKTNAILHDKFGKIRTHYTDNQPWFVAKDVCVTLGIDWKRGLTSRYSLHEEDISKAIIKTNGGPQEITIVNESGLYQLIFQSRKPIARDFSRWITSEVLPSIRKTGSYTTRKTFDVLNWYKGVLCIEHRWLVDNGITTKYAINQSIRRKSLVRIRRSSKGQRSLLLWSSVPQKWKDRIYAQFGVLAIPPYTSLTKEQCKVLQEVSQITDTQLRFNITKQLLLL